MAIYHLYHLEGGTLIETGDIEAESDRDAARIAQAGGRGDLVEIWNASRRVRIVKPGGAQTRAPAPTPPERDLTSAPAG